MKRVELRFSQISGADFLNEETLQGIVKENVDRFLNTKSRGVTVLREKIFSANKTRS